MRTFCTYIQNSIKFHSSRVPRLQMTCILRCTSKFALENVCNCFSWFSVWIAYILSRTKVFVLRKLDIISASANFVFTSNFCLEVLNYFQTKTDKGYFGMLWYCEKNIFSKKIFIKSAFHNFDPKSFAVQIIQKQWWTKEWTVVSNFGGSWSESR